MSNESVIKVFEDKSVRIVWNEQEEKYYFSIADIVQILTDSTDVKQYIKRMRARDPELNFRWGTICTPTRDNMTNVELALNTLAEVATTELSRQSNPQGIAQTSKTAQAGGEVARNARTDLENKLGRSVISAQRASDYIHPIEGTNTRELPSGKDK